MKKLKEIKIISIDHGTSTGWSLVTMKENNSYELAEFGHFVIPGSPTPVSERLIALKRNIALIYERIKPQVVVLERPMSFLNANVSRMLIAMYNIAMIEAAERGIFVIDVVPTAVKKSITGKGSSKKETVAEAVIQRFNLVEDEVCPKHNGKPIFDITDSIANVFHAIEAKRIKYDRLEGIL